MEYYVQNKRDATLTFHTQSCPCTHKKSSPCAVHPNYASAVSSLVFLVLVRTNTCQMRSMRPDNAEAPAAKTYTPVYGIIPGIRDKVKETIDPASGPASSAPIPLIASVRAKEEASFSRPKVSDKMDGVRAMKPPEKQPVMAAEIAK